MISLPALSRRQANKALLVALFSTLAGARVRPAAALARAPARQNLFDFAIAGGRYHGLADVRATLRAGERLLLKRESDNPFDANAVAVLRIDGLKLGYVPRAAVPEIARLLDAGRMVFADILQGGEEEGHDWPDRKAVAYTDYARGDPLIRLAVEQQVGEEEA